MGVIANPFVQGIRRTHPLMWILVTNIIPIIGVLYSGWNAYDIIMMYWIETIIIGFFSLIMILISNSESNYFIRLGLGIFFCFHFGFFCALQGVFIFISLNNDDQDHAEGLKYAAAILAGNYLLHFLKDYIFTGKYNSKESYSLFAPYGRVVVQQFVILLGGYFTVKNNYDENIGMLILLIALKTIVDLVIYWFNIYRSRESAEEKAWRMRHENQ